MKNSTLLIPLAFIAIIGMSFIDSSPSPTPNNLVHTKWISPVSDNCHASLCFTSDQKVMFYECDYDMYMEIGYRVKGDTIEIEAFQDADMNPAGKLILIDDDGVLRQLEDRITTFPMYFVRVPGGSCN